MFLLDILYNGFINYLIFNLTFYLSNTLLFIIDYFQLFTKSKIQKYKIMSTNVVMDTYKKAIYTVLQNSLLYTIPVFVFLGAYDTIYKNDFSIIKFCYDIFIARILIEILFYLIHRIFHSSFFYQRVHKKHHEITTPVGITSIYMTLPDLYIGNILPVYLPLFILYSHPLTIKFWIIATTINTVIFAHSGFEDISHSHDYHHSRFDKNYGTDLFMDKLFGTSY